MKMSVDRRLRNELNRDASKIDFDIERSLGTVVVGGRRKIWMRRAGRIVVVAAVVAIVAFAGPAAMDVIRHQHERPAGPRPAPVDIVGTYATTLQPTDVRGTAALRLQGLWQITVRGDGLITVVPPPGARVSTLRSQYQVEDDRILTTAFANNTCSGVGVYRWSRAGSTLRFTLVSDACKLRVMVFTAHPWEAR
jgi:hypothetical protein